MRTVHPRVCGERWPKAWLTSPVAGSSPRVRGTGDGAQGRLTLDRFIPACAGNGRTRRPPGRAPSVHPRVCGERAGLFRHFFPLFGSSPRVRGTACRAQTASCRFRFIPACAGNGCGTSRRCCCRSVHPRVCGERSMTKRATVTSSGSSPRVRGTGLALDLRGRERRFIPACAGNGARTCAGCTLRPVHPRVCGERATAARSICPSAGSSPRVRGTVSDPAGGGACPRFIPACAGNGFWPR